MTMTGNKSDWYSFYANRINSSYQRYFEFRYHPFLSAILAENRSQIIEIGCGIGSVSKYLRNYNIHCYGFDIDEKMVELANKNLNWDKFFKADLLNIEQAKIFNFDLAISHGVLEHFSDEDIKLALSNYPYSIHFVPTDAYDTPSFGDERLLPVEYWVDNFKPKSFFTFNNDKDLCFTMKN